MFVKCVQPSREGNECSLYITVVERSGLELSTVIHCPDPLYIQAALRNFS